MVAQGLERKTVQRTIFAGQDDSYCTCDFAALAVDQQMMRCVIVERVGLEFRRAQNFRAFRPDLMAQAKNLFTQGVGVCFHDVESL